MRSDPHLGLRISLAIAAMAALWLGAQWFAADALYDALGNGSFAISFLAIVVLLTAAMTALLFRRYARVKADLLAGRDVVARWSVDPVTLEQVSITARTRERSNKKTTLFITWGFIIVIFGVFALKDEDVAPIMIAVGAALGLIVTLAFWVSSRTPKSHLEMRSAEIILGSRGVLNSDVLHVWGPPLSRLSNVKLEEGPPAALTVTYANFSRAGSQYVDVVLPVPPEALADAREVEARFRGDKTLTPSPKSPAGKGEPKQAAQAAVGA